jgi:arginyl-tRNA--protein-N-Asp/Glu arginylyltransferase
VMWQIAQARDLDLAYVYLGYWIEQSPKMAYKINFRPLEARTGGVWGLLDK